MTTDQAAARGSTFFYWEDTRLVRTSVLTNTQSLRPKSAKHELAAARPLRSAPEQRRPHLGWPATVIEACRKKLSDES